MMLLALLLGGCGSAPVPPDAAPFAGAIAVLDHDHDGVVTVAEYPPDASGALPVDEVDRDHDGVVSLVEVRDAVYAIDPAQYDPLATPGRAPGGPAHPLGPLAEALRFLAQVQAERAPDTTPPSREERQAAAAAGMDSPAGAVVLARFAAGGIPVPDAIVHAPADPAADAPQRMRPPAAARERLRSFGPGGEAVVKRIPGAALPERGRPGPARPGGSR